MPHLLDRRADQMRQALAAVLGRLRETVPAVLAELEIRIPETRRRLDRAVVEAPRALAVAPAVERIEDFRRELRRLLEDRGNDIRRRLLETRQACDLVEAGKLGQHEMHLGERGAIG